MSTRDKGRRNELRARDVLLAAGYDVQMAPMPSRWARQQDLWGLWDLVGINAVSIRFVQVKTNKKPSREYTEELAAFVCPANCTKELWIFKDREPKPLIFVL